MQNVHIRHCSFKLCMEAHINVVLEKSAMRSWNHNSAIVFHMQLSARKQTSPIVEYSHLICRTSIYHVQFSSYACKYMYAHIYNDILERDSNACLEPQPTDLSSLAALNLKRDTTDSKAVVCYVNGLYMPYSFELCMREKKIKNEEQNRHFHVRFS